MNGRCSDSTTDVDGDQLINQRQIDTSINDSSEYSVRHLPPSPHPSDGKSLDDTGGQFPEGFEHSAGGTMRWELHQDHMITSTQPESSSRNGTGEFSSWVVGSLIVLPSL